MVTLCFRFCYCDVTNDKIWLLASQNCNSCQVIIICKSSSCGFFSMFSCKSLQFHQISYRNPYNFCFLKKVDWLDFQEAGNLKFSYLGFPLSNFDKSWIAEIVLNWGTRGSCHTDHIWDSRKANFFQMDLV